MSTDHPKVGYGKCPVCGHYGDDCTGTVPDLVACPECGSTDLRELGYRPTNQPVRGLDRTGDARDYHDFDWGDDVIVTGYGCQDCEWFAEADPLTEDRASAAVDAILAAMPVHDPNKEN